MKKFKILLLLILIAFPVFAEDAQDLVPQTAAPDESIRQFNDEIRKTSRRIRQLENGIPLTSGVTGVLPLANGGTGSALVDPNADRILFWDDSAGVFTFLTAGNGLSLSGTTIIVAGAIPQNIQVFTSSGTWTKPANVSTVYVKVIGAGGNGGAANGGSGGGGGGGGYSEGLITVTGDVTVTVGATNSFAGSTTISATAGSVGAGGAASTGGAGGAGGAGSNGTINLTGSIGNGGGSTNVSAGGFGGGTPMGSGGGGGAAIAGGSAGSNGGSYGGGGGGGGGGANPGGGTGNAGAVIVYY